MKSDRRIVVVAVVVLAAIVAVWLVFAHLRPATGIEASGTIEVVQSDISPKVAGRLIDLRVQDGDPVKKGQVLAVLERVDPTLNVDQANANVAAAVAQVNAAQAAYDLQSDQYTTNLTQASSGVNIARNQIDVASANRAAAAANYENARIEYNRAQTLVASGDEPQQMLDAARAAYVTAYNQLHGAGSSVRVTRSQHVQQQANLQFAQAQRALVNQRYALVVAAQGALAQARAALGLAQDQVRETRLLAPFDGYVISHNFEVGDLIQPASAVLTVGDLAHPYMYVYVSETDLPHIKTGMHADVSIDGMPDRTFVGTVTQLGSTAEFTPENVQTKEERIEYLVFRVKIQFTDPTQSLKPGLPADAVIHT